MQFESQNICIVKVYQTKIENPPNKADTLINQIIISNNNRFVCCIILYEKYKEYYNATVRDLKTNQVLFQHDDDADTFSIQFTPDSKYIFFLGEQDYIIFDLYTKQQYKLKFITYEAYKRLKLSFTEDSQYKLIQTNDTLETSHILGDLSEVYQVNIATFDWRFVSNKEAYLSTMQIMRQQKLICFKVFRKKNTKLNVVKSFLLSFEPKYFQKIKAKIWNVNNLVVVQHHFGVRVYNLHNNKLIRNLQYQTKVKPICTFQHLENNKGYVVFSYDFLFNDSRTIEFMQFLPTVEYQSPKPFSKIQFFLGQNSALIQQELESDTWQQITFGSEEFE
ncbi:unnamed protein product (macronuclear) [Paramecium tetraurelia]|uniref:Anaphase-promoting complex subunit 4 WD40 domain-containing protein n=1 Tax=Paramecium tetraurelia TaxID=5888 RepID=A0CH89_PARTE|nr:uncharacterized protein GSPATT00007596001 [Paramecium tetraurelia]CAK70156.1 unnamed protein product [Paramecium tetraurelia]|eukprot:XP_001437553.1 hypothetical protein (macronuclear) [Paramecium tetraurelia strain d4-2]